MTSTFYTKHKSFLNAVERPDHHFVLAPLCHSRGHLCRVFHEVGLQIIVIDHIQVTVLLRQCMSTYVNVM